MVYPATRKELEEAVLVVFVRPDGTFEWASTGNRVQALEQLETVADKIRSGDYRPHPIITRPTQEK